MRSSKACKGKNPLRIACRNGVLDVVEMKLYPFDPQEYNTIFVDRNFNLDVPFSATIDGFLNWCADNDVGRKRLLYEMIGYMFYKRNYFEKAFIFVGKGGTGKSTLLKIAQNLIGEKNWYKLDLQDYDNENRLYETVGKLAVISYDLDKKALKYTGTFKSAVSGETITAAQKYIAPISWIPFAKPIFSCNEVPYIDDKSSGLDRRLVIFKMDKKVPDDKKNVLFMDLLTEQDYEYLFVRAIECMRVVFSRQNRTDDRWDFSTTKREEYALVDYRIRNSNIKSWLAENEISNKMVHRHVCLYLYNDFVMWCERHGAKNIPTNTNFNIEIREIFGCETFKCRDKDDKKVKLHFMFTRKQIKDEQFMNTVPVKEEVDAEKRKEYLCDDDE